MTLICTFWVGALIQSAALKTTRRAVSRVTVHTCHPSMWEGGCNKRTQGLRTNRAI